MQGQTRVKTLSSRRTTYADGNKSVTSSLIADRTIIKTQPTIVEDVADIAEALEDFMKKVDLTHLKPSAGNMKNVPAVLQAVSKAFQKNERFEKLTHGGAKIITAVLNVVSHLFEREKKPTGY